MKKFSKRNYDQITLITRFMKVEETRRDEEGLNVISYDFGNASTHLRDLVFLISEYLIVEYDTPNTRRESFGHPPSVAVSAKLAYFPGLV